MSGECIAVLNAGSSTIKYGCYEIEDGKLKAIFKNTVSNNGQAADALCRQAISEIRDRTSSLRLLCIGHRLVHGGPKYSASVAVSSEILRELNTLSPLDPMHLPVQLSLVDACTESFPDVLQTISFDTAFHHGLPQVAKTIPIPDRFSGERLRRYGFHGISYTYLLKALARVAGQTAANGKIIFAHLGSGSSMAAVSGGECVETTMGFTPAGGFPMQTRSGDIDPGVLIYLLREHRLTADELDNVINRESGVRAVAGSPEGMKELLQKKQAGDSRSGEAITYYCYQARRSIGSLAAALNGLDAIVFSGGIGENSSELRAEICSGLSHLGVLLDENQNQLGAESISASSARVAVWVIPTNEEIEIGTDSLKILQEANRG